MSDAPNIEAQVTYRLEKLTRKNADLTQEIARATLIAGEAIHSKEGLLQTIYKISSSLKTIKERYGFLEAKLRKLKDDLTRETTEKIELKELLVGWEKGEQVMTVAEWEKKHGISRS